MNRLRGVANLVLLTAFLVAVPWALVRWGNWPINGIPTTDQLRDLPDTIVSDTTVFAVLTVAAWVVWTLFCLSLALEFAAALRGVPAPRLAFAGVIQRPAGQFVAAILMAISINNSSGAVAARASPPLPPPQTSHPTAAQPIESRAAEAVPPALVTSAAPPTPSSAPPSEADTSAPAVTVEPGDSAWRIAERHLGDGMRWRDLWDLNHHLPQPDGLAWTNPELVRPGWQLHLPIDAAGQTTAPAPPPAADVHTVHAGDTLSGIAAEHLGDPARYVELFDLNRDVPQPDGDHLENPNLIRPGWRLRLPTPPGPPATSVTPETPAPAPEPAPAPPPFSTPAPTSPATTRPPSTVTPAPDGEDRRRTPDATGTKVDASEPSFLEATAPTLLGITGATVLATGLLLHLRRLRRRRATRTARRRPAREPTLATTERAVVSAADVPLVRWAGQSLAALIARLDGRRHDAAPVAVEISENAGIEVLWDTPAPRPPAPWVVTDGGWAWRLAYDPDQPVPPDEQPAPIPGLVTIGQREGRQLLLDLEAFGSLNVTGDRDAVDAFLRALVLELGTDDELADAYLHLVGLANDFELRRVSEAGVEDALAGLRAMRNSVDAVLEADRLDSTFRYRCGAATGHLETTIVVANLTDPDAVHALVSAAPPRRGVAAVIAGTATLDAGATLTIHADGNAELQPLGLRFTAAGLPAETTERLATLVDETATPPEELDVPVEEELDGQLLFGWHEHRATNADVSGNGQQAPIEEADGPAVVIPEPKLLVRVLGVPRIVERPDMARRPLVLAVYMACKNRPVTTSAVQDAVWNGQAVQAKTIWNLVGRTRAALGALPDGTPAMPQADRIRGTLHLADGVMTDLALLACHYERAQTAPSSEAIDLLRRGLDLVEGPPFDAAGYDWAHHTEQYVAEASALIERAAEQLIDLALNHGDFDLARGAIVAGLRGLPGNEVLYRARMNVEHQAGNLAGVAAAYEELLNFLDELEAEPSPSTVELHQQLVKTARR